MAPILTTILFAVGLVMFMFGFFRMMTAQVSSWVNPAILGIGVAFVITAIVLTVKDYNKKKEDSKSSS
jgi:divalent metal cation (Fe/Co/Zn/Cd) transporter